MICELKFYQAKINYMYKTIVAAIVLIVSLSFSRAFAQTIIHGKVIDEITREPLEQVVLNNFKTFKSTLTDRQ